MDDPARKWILIMINGAFGEGFPMLEKKKGVYSTFTPFEYAPNCNVPAFTKVELSSALRSMCKKESADKSGVFL